MRIKKSAIRPGMKVTCRHTERAWSEYRDATTGKPIDFTPGMVGTVADVDVPSVRREGVSFCNVDWTHTGPLHCFPNTRTVRVSLLYDNIVPITDDTA